MYHTQEPGGLGKSGVVTELQVIWLDWRRCNKSSKESKNHFWLKDLGRLLEGDVFGSENSLICWKDRILMENA